MTSMPVRFLLAVAATAALAACTGVPAGVEPVTGFDAQRYAGTWYSIHRLDHSFERNLTNVSARYTVRPDGSVEVVNRGFDRTKCAWQEVVGTAKFRGSPDVASLGVTFQWPFAGGYHVFALDPEYRWVMISGPTHGYLWILARAPQLAPEVRDRLVAKAREAGFPVEELQTVDQSPPVCADGRAAPAA
jgi:apolipoprotein D and lipocalin family protein